MRPFLLLVRGLGGTGKTTLSTALAKKLQLPLLDRDVVKRAIGPWSIDTVSGTEMAYAVMNAFARFRSMQDFYIKMTKQTQSTFLVINCFCSDVDEWGKRINLRGSNHPISFAETKMMHFEEFDLENQIFLDTSLHSASACLSLACEWLDRAGGHWASSYGRE